MCITLHYEPADFDEKNPTDLTQWILTTADLNSNLIFCCTITIYPFHTWWDKVIVLEIIPDEHYTSLKLAAVLVKNYLSTKHHLLVFVCTKPQAIWTWYNMYRLYSLSSAMNNVK